MLSTWTGSPAVEAGAWSASACPSAVPMSAWVAMAKASSAKAEKLHRELTTWWAASGTWPSAVAAQTVARMATRRDSVRTSRGRPAPREVPRPARWGRRETWAWRAARVTGRVSATAMRLWLIAVPAPEPAIPVCSA